MWLRRTPCQLLALFGNFTRITDGDGVTLSTAGIVVGVESGRYAAADIPNNQNVKTTPCQAKK
jgi:hypothetical protein